MYTFRRIDLDDGFLIFAIFTMTAAFTLGHFLLPIAFIQNDLGLGRLSPADIPDFSEQMFLEKNVETAASAMVWVTIYAVKYSYMFFFKKLVSRVRRLQIWWWCVMGILIPVSLIGSLFDFSICPVFTPNFLRMWPFPLSYFRTEPGSSFSTIYLTRTLLHILSCCYSATLLYNLWKST